MKQVAAGCGVITRENVKCLLNVFALFNIYSKPDDKNKKNFLGSSLFLFDQMRIKDTIQGFLH